MQPSAVDVGQGVRNGRDQVGGTPCDGRPNQPLFLLGKSYYPDQMIKTCRMLSQSLPQAGFQRSDKCLPLLRTTARPERLC